jgi:hypothetical protein
MKTLASFSAAAVAFALTAGALSAQAFGDDPAPKARLRQETAQVRVTNHNWLDARIYLDDGGQLVPFGFVTSQQTVDLVLPARALTSAGPVRIVARPIGSRAAYWSDQLMIGRGDALLVTLQNQLGLSSTTLLPSIE